MDNVRYSLLLFPLRSVALVGCRHVANDDDDEARSRDARTTVFAGEVRLNADAQRAIGLRIAPVERTRRENVLTCTGWLLAIPGHENATRAPATGFYLPADEATAPEVGARQEFGQTIGSIRLLFSPQERAQLVIAKEEADILIQQSRVSMEIAAAQLDAIRDRNSGAVAMKRIKELEEIVERARVAQREAQQKLPFLPTEPYDESLGMKPLPVTSAVAGRVVDVHVQPWQFVVQGDPLLTVADWSTLWLRVPVFSGDMLRIERDSPCRVHAGSMEVAGRPINPPRALEPGRRTIDLFFEVDNSTSAFRPGQSVQVIVERGTWRDESPEGAKEEFQGTGTEESLVVPRSAVLWDGFGETWVYVATSDHSFRRRRIEVGEPTGSGIAVERGLGDDARIVTQGAAALYTEEFKGRIQLDNDND